MEDGTNLLSNLSDRIEVKLLAALDRQEYREQPYIVLFTG
jgi:hypothetical protein